MVPERPPWLAEYDLGKSRGEVIIATAGVHPYHVDESDIFTDANQAREVVRAGDLWGWGDGSRLL